MTQFSCVFSFSPTFNSSPLSSPSTRCLTAPAACLDPLLHVSPAALSWMGGDRRRRGEDTWPVKAGLRSLVEGGSCVCMRVACVFLCFADFFFAAGCRQSSAVKAVEPDKVVRPHTQLVCQEGSNLEERTRAWHFQFIHQCIGIRSKHSTP